MTRASTWPARIAREPLVHFVVAGAVLFSAYYALRGPEAGYDETTTIVVERRDLLGFLQYRANAFEPEIFEAALDAMSEAELEEIIAAYVEEEALYREAKALGLEDSDYVVRQRMVQKMTFLIGDLVDPASVDEAELARYFEANIDAYAIEPWTTFTHVFFDAARRGDEGALSAAEAALAELNGSGALFNDAPRYGDSFPFLRNYVERTFDFVASHFGDEFANRLAALEPSTESWQGPFRSAYGEHLVMLTRRAERSYPTLADVRTRVESDLAAQRANAALVELTDAVRERYRVVVDDDVRAERR